MAAAGIVVSALFAPLTHAQQTAIGHEQETATNPVAAPQAAVVFGNVRFTVLTPQLIRMEWSANGRFEDHASFVFLNRKLPVPAFSREIAHHRLTIKTSALTLTYLQSGDGRFLPGNLTIRLKVDGKDVEWHPGMAETDNLLGTVRTLDGARGSQTRTPIEPGLIARSGWTLVDDSARPLFDSSDFSFRDGEKSPWPWVMERPANEAAGAYNDWYFFGYGHDYKKALGDYVRVAGRIPLPPRFAFGVWWSRYWAYNDQELDGVVRGFRENNAPLDVLVIDMDWHKNVDQLKAAGEVDQSGQRLGWSGYTWNKYLFPYPDEFLAKMHREGLRATLNLHPASGVQPWEDAYPAMARAMGIDPATHKYVPFNITDKKYATNYMELLHHPLEKQGIDFWWLDWQQQSNTAMAGVNPTWWLNYVHFTDQQREGKRPLLFHRWGGLGNHRYQIGFSGDTVSVWESLAFQPWFTATAANVGYAYWSHDIGGHAPVAETLVAPELYTRWVQFGVFSPILRTHASKNPAVERRIWAYPEPYSSVLRSAFQLRESMEPYLYTEARRTYDTGVAFLRPLYYDWPQDEAAYTSKNEYLFGDQLLVAPVAVPAENPSGLASENVWLPKGEWIEWPTGKHFAGPVTAERRFSIEQIPVYVKAGAIVPMQPPMLHTGEKPVDPLILNVWPLSPGASSSYSLYEDSGVSVDYQKGIFARTPIKATQTGDTLQVEIEPVEGSYPGMLKSRAYELRLHADWPPASVTINGKPLEQAKPGQKEGWTYEGNTLSTVISIPAASVKERITVDVRRASGLTARRNELDGFSGQMTRLRGAYDALNLFARISQPPDALLAAMQTGDRLSYHPERASEELAHFHDAVSHAADAVNNTTANFRAKLDTYAKRMLPGTVSEAEQTAAKKRFLDALAAAEQQCKAASLQ
ncbi:MAG: glycoside hydrolase family 31 protein [Terracidiphilus sp.]|nr:glycoside hydrolase family 31 protein [Terracidiphilus sp.]